MILKLNLILLDLLLEQNFFFGHELMMTKKKKYIDTYMIHISHEILSRLNPI